MPAHLKGIRSSFVSTKRIRSHVLSSGDSNDKTLVLMHGNLSSATFFEELMLALLGQYRCIAPDIRGFGETEDLPIDATRGLRDPADDLRELLDTLGIEAAHLAGWSAGAGIITQFAIDYPERTNSLTLIAPVSPYGFGGTIDTHGTLAAEDFSGSGGGTISSDVVEQMRLADPGSDSPFAARQLLRNVYVKPPLRLAREDAFIDAIYSSKINEQHYPGDYVKSEHWPFVAPGNWGIINAMSPKYYNVSTIVDMQKKPPILWVRGDADIVVSDNSAFDLVNHYDEESEQGSKGPSPQPMIGQTREVLSRYAENGGSFEEVVLDGVGHSPFLENLNAFLSSFTRFLSDKQHRI